MFFAYFFICTSPKINHLKAKLFALKAYLRFIKEAGNRHSLHSPFVYEFADKVIYSKLIPPEVETIEALRKTLINRKQVVEITDFGSGAGKKKFVHRFERVSDIATRSSISRKHGRLLFAMVQYFKPAMIIELGTSLGLGTLYLALAAPDTEVETIEGCTTISSLANENFALSGSRNITQHIGSFDVILPGILPRIKLPCMVYIDGNHTYAATIKHFEMLAEVMDEHSILIFDDIHWSEGMERAWNEIKASEKVTITIDLFRFGIVFFRKGIIKQNFVLKY